MRREARTVLMVATLLAAAATAMAGIKDTKHDMSSASAGATFKATNTDQICVFCHTPHNSKENIPLWNRTNPAGTTFALYTSSSTFDDKPTDNNNFTSDSISLFCMSCHDGTTGLGGAVHNDPNGVAITMAGGNDLITGDANLGDATNSLRNDHPVNFNVTGADTAIVAKVDNKIGGLPLFKSARGSSSLECGSCHSVHDNTNAPFLRATMAGSALCLKCHIK